MWESVQLGQIYRLNDHMVPYMVTQDFCYSLQNKCSNINKIALISDTSSHFEAHLTATSRQELHLSKTSVSFVAQAVFTKQ